MTTISRYVLLAAIVSLFFALMDSISFVSDAFKYVIDIVFVLLVVKFDPLKLNGSTFEKEILISAIKVPALPFLFVIVTLSYLTGSLCLEWSHPFPFSLCIGFVCYWLVTKMYETR
jgi:hypothetical protein